MHEYTRTHTRTCTQGMHFLSNVVSSLEFEDMGDMAVVTLEHVRAISVGGEGVRDVAATLGVKEDQCSFPLPPEVRTYVCVFCVGHVSICNVPYVTCMGLELLCRVFFIFSCWLGAGRGELRFVLFTHEAVGYIAWDERENSTQGQLSCVAGRPVGSVGNLGSF